MAEHRVKLSFGMGHLGGGWPSGWSVSKLGYRHSAEKTGEGLACSRGSVNGEKGAESMGAMWQGLGGGSLRGRSTEAYRFLTWKKTGEKTESFQVGWTWTVYHKLRLTGRRPLETVLGVLTSREVDTAEGPQERGKGPGLHSAHHLQALSKSPSLHLRLHT